MTRSSTPRPQAGHVYVPGWSLFYEPGAGAPVYVSDVVGALAMLVLAPLTGIQRATPTRNAILGLLALLLLTVWVIARRREQANRAAPPPTLDNQEGP